MSKTQNQIRAYHAKWRANHPNSVKASQQKYWKNNKHKRWPYRLQWCYGLTVDQWKVMIETQKGKCKICDKSLPLQVDHCHKTNKVRSMLCGPCNRFVGGLEADYDRLVASLKYIGYEK